MIGVWVWLAAWVTCIATCLVSCADDAVVPRSDASSLAAIDSVMQQRPDSALALLLGCRDAARHVSTDPTDRHYYQLLLSEALYKNDSVQRNRKALQQAMAYLDSLVCGTPPSKEAGGIKKDLNPTSNFAFLAARAHYMNGVGYYENDSAVEACQEYMKALDIMEEHFKEKELVGYKAKFMALTYTHLTSLFSDLYLHEQAIYFGKKAWKYYQNYDATPWHIAWILNTIGVHYEMMDKYDGADYYYHKSLMFQSDTNHLMYRDIKTSIAFLSYNRGGDAEFSLYQLHQLLDMAESEKEYFSRCMSIGTIYFDEQQFDSAWIYLNKVYLGNTNTNAKKQAAEWLVEICKAQGREADIMEYADFLVPFATQEENNRSDIKSQFTELYSAFRQGISERQHQRMAKKNALFTAVAIGGLLIIILVIFYFYYKNKRRLSLLVSQKPEVPAKAQDKLLAFMEEPVCQEIIHSVQGQNIKRLATPKAFPELVLTDAQLQQLSMAANRHFAPIEILLEQHGLKAKPALVNLCQLYLLGMDEKQAAILLNRDYSSVKRYEKTLKTAFHTQENMVAFMRNLVLKS